MEVEKFLAELEEIERASLAVKTKLQELKALKIPETLQEKLLPVAVRYGEIDQDLHSMKVAILEIIYDLAKAFNYSHWPMYGGRSFDTLTEKKGEKALYYHSHRETYTLAECASWDEKVFYNYCDRAILKITCLLKGKPQWQSETIDKLQKLYQLFLPSAEKEGNES